MQLFRVIYPIILVYNQRNVEIPDESQILSFGRFCSSTKTAIDLRLSSEHEAGVERHKVLESQGIASLILAKDQENSKEMSLS